MDYQEAKQQAREIINELLEYPFSQTFDILPAEQKLKLLYQQVPSSLEALIGLMLANIMLGNRATALGLSDKIWSLGGELSPFFELLYSDNLLNLGEVDKVGILLAQRLNNIGENLPNFYMVMVKYALLSGKLTLLKQIGQYPDVYQQEPDLFDFADNHALDLSVKDYRAVIRIILDNLKETLCAFEYNMHPEDGLELLLYTSLDVEQNSALQQQLFAKINGYFMSMQQPKLDDLFLKVLNIKLHPSWLATDN